MKSKLIIFILSLILLAPVFSSCTDEDIQPTTQTDEQNGGKGVDNGDEF